MTPIVAIIKFTWFQFKQLRKEKRVQKMKAGMKRENPNINPIYLLRVDMINRTGLFAPDDEEVCKMLGIPDKYLIYEEE